MESFFNCLEVKLLIVNNGEQREVAGICHVRNRCAEAIDACDCLAYDLTGVCDILANPAFTQALARMFEAAYTKVMKEIRAWRQASFARIMKLAPRLPGRAAPAP